MCIQVVERYSMCRCMYYKHAIDPCGVFGRQGHRTVVKTLLVGYACPRHSSGGGGGSSGRTSSSRSLKTGSESSQGDDRLQDIHRVEQSLIVEEAEQQTQPMPLESRPLLDATVHPQGDPQRLITREMSENIQSSSVVPHFDSELEVPNDTTAFGPQLNLKEEATAAEDGDWENITYWVPGPTQQKVTVDEERSGTHGTQNNIVIKSANSSSAHMKMQSLELDGNPIPTGLITSAWNRFQTLFRHIANHEWTALLVRGLSSFMFDYMYYRENMESLIYRCIAMAPFQIEIPQGTFDMATLTSTVTAYMFGGSLTRRFPIVRKALMRCQSWQQFVQSCAVTTQARSVRCYHMVTSRSLTIWNSVRTNTEDYCENLGNGLLAANYRSLGYGIKSWSDSANIKVRVRCRCGQKHTFAHWANGKRRGESDTHLKAKLAAKCVKCWERAQTGYVPSRASGDRDSGTATPSTLSDSQRQGSSNTVTTSDTTKSTSQPTATTSQRCGGLQQQSELTPTPIVGTQTTGTFIPHDQRFLLLCVNVSKYGIALQHVNVNSAVNDLNLFSAIRQGYNDARVGRPWSIFRSLDQPVRFNLTKFCLVPRRTDIRVGVLDFPSIPPLEEVKIHNRYHYCMCIEPNGSPYLPMNTVFMEAFFDPVEHTTRWWIDHLPKKLKEPLVYDPDLGTLIGWGIHIVEGPNLLLFSLIVFVTLFILIVLCMVWVLVLGGSVSDAFTLGSFVLALVVAGSTLAYHHWQQRGVARA